MGLQTWRRWQWYGLFPLSLLSLRALCDCTVTILQLTVCECETLNISRLMASLVTQGFMIRSYDAPNDAGRGSLWPSLRIP